MNDKTTVSEITSDISHWKILTWAIPFIALALTVLLQFMSFDNIFEILAASIATAFVVVIVCWWWWALITIQKILKLITSSSNELTELKLEVESLREDFSVDKHTHT